MSRRRSPKAMNKPSSAALRAVAVAESLLPGRPAQDGKRDARWQVIIRLATFIESDPELLWRFCVKWGKHAQDDLRAAVACCLLEHLLEEHRDLIPAAKMESRKSVRFAKTYAMCWAHRTR